jgi:prepilin-type N-terminal cleavage/methylation domain-containing protein
MRGGAWRPLRGRPFLPTNRSMRARTSGFTLVELMIVVAIISILAAIGSFGYRRWIGRARLTEGVTMLAEMNSKEQSYRMEFGTFLPLRADANATMPSPDEPGPAFFPSNPNAASFDSVRTPVSVANSAVWPVAWRAVGVSPRDTSLYCTYLTNAGGAGQAVPAGAPMGAMLVAGVAAPWFYGLAACNLNGPAGFSANVTVLGISSTSPALRTFNDGQ